MYNTNMIISSTKNEKIKQIKKLMSEKDIIVLDNPKLINEALSVGNQLIEVVREENSKNKITENDILVTENVFNHFTNTITSQGVIALVKLKQKEVLSPKGNFLILDRVQDPGNVGTLIRSAVGAGFLDIYLINCARVNNPKTIRSTMGAIFKANFYEVNQEFLNTLKIWNKPIYVADMDGSDIYNMSFEDNCGIVVGNEGKGVSQELEQIANLKIKIPMLNGLESLNAGVSGSIIMYQIANGGKNVRT